MRSFGRDTDRHENEQDIDPAVAEGILGVDHEALAGLNSTCGHRRFGCRGAVRAITRI